MGNATIPRVPTGGTDNASARVQIANSLNAALAQLATAQATIATLSGTLGGDLTGTLPNPTVAANKIDNTKLAQMATKTIKGNNGVGTANAVDLTADQAKALLGGTLAQAPVVSETGAVATGTGVFPALADTALQNTGGDQYLSATITPKNASSTLIIEVVAFFSSSVASVLLEYGLFQDTTASALACGAAPIGLGSTGFIQFVVLRHVMTAGTTSATTFKFRAGQLTGSSATITFNGVAAARKFAGTMASSIKITEILP